MERKSDADVLLADSPFSLAPNAPYLERLQVRRRKPRNTADDENEYEEDVPPPPTVCHVTCLRWMEWAWIDVDHLMMSWTNQCMTDWWMNGQMDKWMNALQTSLSSASGFLSDHLLGGGDLGDATAHTAKVTAAVAASFPNLHGDDWGSDKQYWVTVYGFPASSKAYILHQFQTVGEVVNFTAGAGNWLHLRYYTRLQAEKALSYDGRTLAGQLMIGVKKCYASDLEGVREEPTSNIFVSSARQQNPGSRCVLVVVGLSLRCPSCGWFVASVADGFCCNCIRVY